MKTKDTLDIYGRIHNTYKDLVKNEYRIKGEPLRVWIYTENEFIILDLKELRRMYKEAKRIVKGKIRK